MFRGSNGLGGSKHHIPSDTQELFPNLTSLPVRDRPRLPLALLQTRETFYHRDQLHYTRLFIFWNWFPENYTYTYTIELFWN